MITTSYFTDCLSQVRNVALFLLLTCIATLLTTHLAQAGNLLIRNVHIISGEKPQASELSDVLIKNGKIHKIGYSLPDAENIIDGREQFLIPGLIDTHVHLADGLPGYRPNNQQKHDFVKTSKAQISRSYLYFGFTTLLDLASHQTFIDQWNRQSNTPRAYFCKAITIPNGYPIMRASLETQFTAPMLNYMLFDQNQSSVYPATFIKKRHTPENIVRRIKSEGAKCIKVFYEKGFGRWKNLPVPSVSLIREVVKQAHALGLKVYLHGNSQSSYEFALKVKVDTLVHGMWHWSDLSTAKESTIDQFAKRFADSNISVQPTIQVIYGEQAIFDPNFFVDKNIQHAIPKSLIKWYMSDDGQWMKYILRENFDKEITDPVELYQTVNVAYQRPIKNVMTMTKKLSEQHAELLFGSDTPSGPFYTQFHGVNGRWEMDRWIDAGLNLQTLFESMTIRNATSLGLENSIGQVAIGMRADLLLLAENPLVDVSAYDSIETVILNGKPLNRNALSAKVD